MDKPMPTLEPLDPTEALDWYLNEKEAEAAASTMYSHKSRLGHFLRWCDQRDMDNLNDLTGRDMHRYKVWRRQDGDLNAVTLKTTLKKHRIKILASPTTNMPTRRQILATTSTVSVAGLAGCSGMLNSANCGHAYRDVTISDIGQDDQDAAFTFAGKITKRPQGYDWFLFSDGTGTAKVGPSAGSGDQFAQVETGQCIQLTGRVGNPDVGGDNVDITIYIAELDAVPTTTASE